MDPRPWTSAAQIALLGCLLLAPSAGLASTKAPGAAEFSSSPRPYSLLLITADSLRFDAGEIGTARYDAAVPASLRKRGHHFVHALAAGVSTAPGITAILTGRYPFESGLLGGDHGVSRPPGWLLAEKLRTFGFATAAVVSNAALKFRPYGFAAGFGSFDGNMTGTSPDGRLVLRRAAETTDAALRRLRKLVRGRSRWFLWVHYWEPHGPYQAPKAFLQPAAHPGDPLPVWSTDYAPKGWLPRFQFSRDARGRNDYLARYRASAAHVLSEIDRLLAFAESIGILQKAAVVFTADHGEFLGERDYWFQHNMRLDPALLHIPLVIARSCKDPRAIDPRPAGQVDVLPTVMSLLLGVENPETRGVDLLAPERDRRHPLIAESLDLPRSIELGIADAGSFLVRSSLEPPRDFRREGSLWSAGEPSRESLERSDRTVRLLLRRIRAVPRRGDALSIEDLRRLRSLGYLR